MPLKISRDVALGFVERSKALGLTGKRRDDEAITYYCGAISSLLSVGNEEAAGHLQYDLKVFVALRGYKAVCEYAGVKPE